MRISRLGTQPGAVCKRLTASLLLAVGVALVTTACGSSQPAASGPNGTSQPETTAAATAAPTRATATPTAPLHPVTTRIVPPASLTAGAATRTAELTPTPSTTTPVQVAQADFKLASSGGFFTDLLKSLPDSTNTRQIAQLENWSPFWTALKDNGVDRPGPNAPPHSVFQGYVQAMQSLKSKGISPATALPPMIGPWICCPTSYLSSEPDYQDLGLGVRDVDFSVIAGEQPKELGIVQGNYDPQRTAAALAACQCDQPKKISYSSTTFDRWGPDLQGDLHKRLQPPLYDQLGRGGRLSVGNGYALYALWDQGIESLIDAYSGRTTTLGDSPDYQLAARGLAALGAFEGAFSARDFGVGAVCKNAKPCASLTAMATSEPLLEPFAVAALGLVQDDATHSHLALVLVQKTPAEAQANAKLLAARFQVQSATNHMQFGVSRLEVSTDGRTILANLYTDSGVAGGLAPQLWITLPGGPFTSK